MVKKLLAETLDIKLDCNEKVNEKKHIDKLLDSIDWEIAWKEIAWKEIPGNESQCRIEDDSRFGSVSVAFTCDGDGWIGFCPDPSESFNRSFRYRVPDSGGGRSPRVRKALMILAMAIKADNEDDPITRRQREE